jgi:hypothetical protein
MPMRACEFKPMEQERSRKVINYIACSPLHREITFAHWWFQIVRAKRTVCVGGVRGKLQIRSDTQV